MKSNGGLRRDENEQRINTDVHLDTAVWSLFRYIFSGIMRKASDSTSDISQDYILRSSCR